MSFVIAGIHTGIGKTVCAAVLCQALGFDYWKPVQAGLDETDSDFIRKYVTNPACKIHPEAFKLSLPASPHFAAAQEGKIIAREKIVLPFTDNQLIIETAGGLMSPLHQQFLNIDLAKQLSLPVILVSNDYLGSINHTLLSAEALQTRNIPVAGIIFSGKEVSASRQFILEHTGLRELLSIPAFEQINAQQIASFANHIRLKV